MKYQLFLIIITLLLFTSGCEFLIDEELNKVVKTGRWEDCKTLGEADDSRVHRCISKIALNKGDSDICGEIGDDYYKDDCFSEMVLKTHEISLCNQVSEANRPSCYTKYAVQEKSVFICDDIGEEQQDAKEDCIVEVAASGEDHLEMCMDVKNPSKHEKCVMNFAKAAGGYGVCVQLNSESKQIQCYHAVAKEKQDEKSCRMIENSPLDRSRCYKDVAVLKQDESLCADVNDDTMKDDCYLSVGTSVSKATICNDINNVEKKNSCYLSVATNKGEWEVCERIPAGLDRDNCIHQAALQSRVFGDCDHIEDEEIKKDCIADLGN